MNQFSQQLLAWFDQHGRKDLPWQHPRSAYRVWISEIMLQQTQVKTVIPYFNRFITSFPTIKTLAQAEEDWVLSHWSGLGYYHRARNLHKTAKILCEQYHGEIPQDLSILISLPGIGSTTAAAITSQAYNLPTAILDGNVKRVLCRYFLIGGWPEQTSVKKELWQRADECMPLTRCAEYTQAIMDLGATCCTSKKPQCFRCPLQTTCLAYINNLTLAYPKTKPKKKLPQKEQQFLLLYNSELKIYLEKRPASGLWGGLWCPPIIDQGDPESHLKEYYQQTCLNISKLTTIQHSLSHFHLTINALAIKTTPIENHMIAESPGKWFTLEELDSLGLAKPVNDIIQCFISKI